MTENQFDELFRNKLKDYSSQVPDNMWERIHPEKDRDRKLFFIWLKYVIVPVFTLAGLAGGFYIGARPAAHHSLSHSSVSSADSSAATGSPLAPSNNAEVSGAHSSVSATSSLISVTPPSVSVPARNTNSASNPAIQHTHKTSKTIHPSAPSAFTPADPLSAPASRLSVAHDPNKTPASGSFKHLPLPGIQPIPNTRFHPAIDQLPKTAFPPVKKTTTHPPTPKSNILSPLKKGSWSVDLYASPDLPVLQIKQDFEKAQLSFTIGMKVNRSFGDHVSAATGVQYSQINEKVAYNDSNATSPIRYGYLKRTSFDFPLLIGYGIGDDRFRATLNAGMIFKIHSFGNIYTTSNSLYLGVNLAKKINDKISLFAEPYYRYNLPGGGNSQYYIQRINLAGLSIGLRYNFKKSGRHKQYDTNN
jgi:hypothetical protein